MTVPHPVRARAAQLFGGGWLFGLDYVGCLHEEPSHHAPQAGASNAGVTVLAKAGDQWRLRVPAFRRNREFSLDEILVECSVRKRRQRHLAGLATLADQMQPVIAALVNTDIGKHRANQFTCAQARRIAEVEQEAQPLPRRLRRKRSANPRLAP